MTIIGCDDEVMEYNELYTPACVDAKVEPLDFWLWLKHRCIEELQ